MKREYRDEDAKIAATCVLPGLLHIPRTVQCLLCLYEDEQVFHADAAAFNEFVASSMALHFGSYALLICSMQCITNTLHPIRSIL